MTRRLAAALGVAVLLAGPPAPAHHVGAWSPRDNEVSANFKQLKFSLQAGKLDVARRLYVEGALRRELLARRAALPPGLDAAIRRALEAGDVGAAEGGLMVFVAALARDLAREAERQLADPADPPAARLATGRRFLEAVWRYYNLIDFAVTQRDARAATTVRLAFDEAEGIVRGPARGASPAPPAALEPTAAVARLGAVFRRVAEVLDGLVARAAPGATG